MSIFVWVEQFKGKPAPVSLEALGLAQRLAHDLGGPVTALVFGEGADPHRAAQTAFHYGADAVLVADDATLASYRLAPYAALVTKLTTEHTPKVVLAGATTRGRDVMGSAAFDLDAGLLSDVTALRVTDGNITATRPIYAGKLHSTEVSTSDITFVTIRARAFPLPKADPSKDGEAAAVLPVLAEDDISTQEESFEATVERVSLADAVRIVSGGRGVNGPEGFETLRVLAEALDAAIGASRAAVDAGWIAYEHQIGQTGKVVSPDLYIACGISGAIQHLVGMRTSKVIVAINKDPNAPIFKLARYGVVADLFDLVPALAAAIAGGSEKANRH